MKLDPKQVQQELKQGFAWPVYWLYGPERLKMRELVQVLRKQVVADNTWAEERLEGGGLLASDVVAAAQSIPFGGGTRFVLIRDAHLIKDQDGLAELVGPRAPVSEVPYVCVFLSKDLDARRKFSKLLIDSAAVVSCETVPEDQRETWIRYLAGSLGVSLERLPMEALVRSEPWTLEWVESELSKYSLAEAVEPGLGADVLVGGTGGGVPSEQFIQSFLENRNLRGALQWVHQLSRSPEDALPLLGLLSWNVRMLSLLAGRSRSVKLSPFVEGKLQRALRLWNLEDLKRLQQELFELDFALKQTPQEPLALWGVLIEKFCR